MPLADAALHCILGIQHIASTLLYLLLNRNPKKRGAFKKEEEKFLIAIVVDIKGCRPINKYIRSQKRPCLIQLLQYFWLSVRYRLLKQVCVS